MNLTRVKCEVEEYGMTEEEFEKRRLAFFAANGLEMRSRRVEDRQGRTLYAMENASAGEPVIVMHGGWCRRKHLGTSVASIVAETPLARCRSARTWSVLQARLHRGAVSGGGR